MLAINTKAPEFTLKDQTGKVHSLADFSGRWLVVYFYPKDNTPGCTKEACNFRDSYHTLEKLGVALVGISKDSVESHQRFAEKHSLNFPILSDQDKKVIEAYGAWQVKKFFGKEISSVARMTYLIDPDGKVRKIYQKVNPLTHSGEIVKDFEALLHQN